MAANRGRSGADSRSQISEFLYPLMQHCRTRFGSKADVTLLNFDVRYTPKADIGLASAPHSTHRSYLQRVMDNSLQIVSTVFTAIDLVGHTMTPGDYIFLPLLTR